MAGLRHHFAGRGNRFWRLSFDTVRMPEPIGFEDDVRLPEWGYGLTKVVTLAMRSTAPLTQRELAADAGLLRRRRCRPGAVALGEYVEGLAGVPVLVVANPSGRNTRYTDEDMRHENARLAATIRQAVEVARGSR